MHTFCIIVCEVLSRDRWMDTQVEIQQRKELCMDLSSSQKLGIYKEKTLLVVYQILTLLIPDPEE